jgi:hypothetical protein
MTMSLAVTKLLKTEDVADILGVTARKVRDLPIPFIRVGKNRRYHPRHVQAFMSEAVECQSASVKVPRSITMTSSLKVVGLSEALKLHPVGKRSA